MGKKGKFELNAVNLLSYVLKRLKFLIIISVGAGIITAGLSLLIPNMYKSEIVLYAAGHVNVARSVADYGYGVARGEILMPGEDEETDVLMQILKSGDIYEAVANKHNLWSHYKIKPSKNASKQLYSRLSSNIDISRTEYNSVRIKVWDEDPAMAAAIASTINDQSDSVFKKMENVRAEKAYVLVKESYDSINVCIKQLEDSLQFFNKKGIFDVKLQSAELTKAYNKALLKGKKDAAKQVKEQMGVFELYAGKFMALNQRLDYMVERHEMLGAKVAIADMARKNDLPRKFVVSSARVSEFKDKPKRSIIVMVATVAAFFVSLFGFVIAENYKKLL